MRATTLLAALAILAVLATPWAAPGLAATSGDLFAEGYRYLTGQGTDRDATQAARLFLEAAKEGEPQAQYQLGVMHMEGLGVPRDLVWAFFWLDRAAASPSLPQVVKNLAKGRMEVIRTLLTSDQKRRLGLRG